MATWDSSTKWRQGHLLPAEAIRDLNLSYPNNESATVAIVITHDCDLAQDPGAEPTIEIIVGGAIEVADGNFAYAKSVRTLHLNCTNGPTKKIIELRAPDKSSIPKEILLGYEPEQETSLTYEELVVLQRWLAARYHRSAFPDEFVRRIKHSGIEDVLKNIIKKFGVYLRAIFFDVDEGAAIERVEASDTYNLNAILLYDTDNDPSVAEGKAVEASDAIKKAFVEKCCKGSVWVNIELQSCEVMSDQAISFRQSLSLKEWRAEHVSLKGKPPQPSLRN